MFERRKLDRQDVCHRVLYRKVDREGPGREPRECSTLNASDGGMCLRVAEDLPAGEVLELQIFAGEGRDPVHGVGRIIWCRPGEAGTFLAGVEFQWIGSPLPQVAVPGFAGSLWSFL